MISWGRWSLHDGVSALIRDPQRSFPPPTPPCEHTREVCDPAVPALWSHTSSLQNREKYTFVVYKPPTLWFCVIAAQRGLRPPEPSQPLACFVPSALIFFCLFRSIQTTGLHIIWVSDNITF